MTFEQALISFLLKQSELTNKINNKVFPDIIPLKSTLPAISINEISASEEIVFSGHNSDVETIFQFEVRATTKTDSLTIIEIVNKIFRELKSSNDFEGYKLDFVICLDKLPSIHSNNCYIEKREFKFRHNYIDILV